MLRKKAFYGADFNDVKATKRGPRRVDGQKFAMLDSPRAGD
jgi:hypothetical protein